jgi:type IV secretory pathway TrbD component
MNGTLAGAVGLGLRLWLVGIAIWAIGHFAAVWAAKRDPLFVEVGRGICASPVICRCEGASP